MKRTRTLTAAIASTLGALTLGALLAVGAAPAHAAKPVDAGRPDHAGKPGLIGVEPCSIVSKVITLGHDRWMVKARLFRADKRYPRHAMTLNTIAPDGTVTPVAASSGDKKAQWNWRMTGLVTAGETLQVKYAGDDATLPCDGDVLSPKARPRKERPVE